MNLVDLQNPDIELHGDAFVAWYDMTTRGYEVFISGEILAVRDSEGAWVAGQRCDRSSMCDVADAMLLMWRRVRITEQLQREHARTKLSQDRLLIEETWTRVLNENRIPAHDE